MSALSKSDLFWYTLTILILFEFNSEKRVKACVYAFYFIRLSKFLWDFSEIGANRCLNCYDVAKWNLFLKMIWSFLVVLSCRLFKVSFFLAAEVTLVIHNVWLRSKGSIYPWTTRQVCKVSYSFFLYVLRYITSLFFCLHWVHCLNEKKKKVSSHVLEVIADAAWNK